jgi:polysaccharide export outer membrane protein
MFARWRVIAQCLCLVIGCGLAFAQTSELSSGSSAGGANRSSNSSGPRLQTERHPQYRVMPSDVLAVSFALSTELNQTVTVQPDGFINLANVGSVYVQGQTTPEIVETLKKAYAKVLHDPIIGVDLTNFQAPQFSIFGHVQRPGQYQLRRETTVSQAIAIGGGFLTSAKSQAFLLRRISSEWIEVKKLNLKPLTQGKNLSEDVYLQPGDLIYVPETMISKFRRYLPYGGVSGVSPLGVASLITQND